MRQAPPSPPVPAIIAARARGESIPPADPVPARAPSRAGSVTRKTSAPVNKGKGKSKLPGLGLPMGVLPEEEAEDRWMAGQRSELDAKERDNQRRAGVSISDIDAQFSVLGNRVYSFPKAYSRSLNSSSSGLNRAVQDSSLPVPISDTPVIVRNREIRQASQSRRRSSLSSRGKRASQSLNSGLLGAHSTHLFPRHLLPTRRSRSPRRFDFDKFYAGQHLEHLINGQPTNPPNRTRLTQIHPITSNQTTRIRTINTTISPARTSDSNKVLPPHPKNVTNAQAISKLEAYNQACQAEDSAWSELIAARAKDIELDDQWQEGMQLVKEVLRTVKEGVGDGADADDEMSDGEQEIVDRIGALEPQVYEAYESTYRMDQFTTKAAVHLENVFGTLASTLRQRTAPQSTLVPRDETGRMALTGPGSASGTSAAKVNGIPPRALNEALQKVTPVNAAPTPRKPPGLHERQEAESDGQRNDELVEHAPSAAYMLVFVIFVVG
ncbi:hypothetical protein RHS01_04173 [Rhizoctonia solani]|uniref:Uncharacterized protein n=1 Tax=Rhizoctonia solani TaxID=456999 RepID=A0A8H7IEB0_9AGAM|nr:hypothetical protein RHS01_04173 [Rhizoctonia solani]